VENKVEYMRFITHSINDKQLLSLYKQQQYVEGNNIIEYCCYHLEQREYFELKVLVDYDTAPSLTMGQQKIEDILVLHLEGGKDFFVSLL